MLGEASPLMMLLKYKLFRASFLHLTKDSDIMGHAAQMFLKVKTLLNNAFKHIPCLLTLCNFSFNFEGGRDSVGNSTHPFLQGNGIKLGFEIETME